MRLAFDASERKNADDDEFYIYFFLPFRTAISSPFRCGCCSLLLLLLLFCFTPLASGFILQCPSGILMDPSPANPPLFVPFLSERVLSSLAQTRGKWPKDFGACLKFHSCGDAGAFLQKSLCFSLQFSSPQPALAILRGGGHGTNFQLGVFVFVNSPRRAMLLVLCTFHLACRAHKMRNLISRVGKNDI